ALGRRLAPRAVVVEHDTVPVFAFSGGDEPEGDIARDGVGRPVEPVLPPAHARRAVDEHVAGLDHDLVDLRREPLLGPVRALEDPLRAPARLAHVDAPRPRQPAVVVDRDLARLEIDVALLDAVAPA